MDATAFSAPLAAFVGGLVTSIHCSGMCGPLGCALFATRDASRSSVHAATALYHGMRVISYASVGAALGALGDSAGSLFSGSPIRLLPWAFTALFILFALGVDRLVPQPRFLSGLLMRLKLRAPAPAQTATLLGLATPLLPCGPLYVAFGVALFAGSALHGALLMAAFALGTMPLFWLLQSQFIRLQLRLSPAALQWTRRGLALVAAVIVGWRASLDGFGLMHGGLCH